MKAKSKRTRSKYFRCLRCGGRIRLENYYPLKRMCDSCGTMWSGYGLDDVWYYLNEKENLLPTLVPSGCLLVLNSEAVA